ncbi:MAG: heat-shock protein Hsp20 [Mycobacterium sp.]|jgi:HSP20 family protein|nr:heat-shock protein Hsp20 [Mycobacterium sp.]
MLRFDPFSESEAVSRGLTSQTGPNRSPPFMPMDLYQVDDHYVITADLPGVDPGSVDLSVENGTLTLTAHRSARSEDSARWLASERFFGTYRRQLSLGEEIDSAAITATYDNGVLTVTIPVAERAKPRRIEVADGDATRSTDSD